MKHKQCSADQTNMSSLRGYVNATYDELCRCFGAPTVFIGDKTNAEWFIEFEDSFKFFCAIKQLNLINCFEI
jgi:hypothetical protein